MDFGREKKTPWPGDPAGQDQAQDDQVRPKITKMRPKMAKMRPKMAKMGPRVTGPRGL